MTTDEKDRTVQHSHETCDEELEEARRQTRELSTLLDISMALAAISVPPWALLATSLMAVDISSIDEAIVFIFCDISSAVEETLSMLTLISSVADAIAPILPDASSISPATALD